MPMGRIKVFNGFQFQSGGVDFFFNRGQFLAGPKLVRVARQSPAGVVAHRLVVHPPQFIPPTIATHGFLISTAVRNGGDGCYGGRAGLVAARGPEVIDQVNDKVRATALPGKAVMFRIELVPIKSKTEFHGEIIGKSGRFGY